MRNNDFLDTSYSARLKRQSQRLLWQFLHLDFSLFFTLLLIAVLGLFILYSASNENFSVVLQQASRLGIGFLVMFVLAQIPPHRYQQWTPWFFAIALLLLILVLPFGQWDHGAKRWLGIGALRFQPSELMKLALPMMLSYYLNDRSLPPSFTSLLMCAVMLIIPVVLTAKQPDLGTAIIIAASGIFILFLAGLRFRIIFIFLAMILASLPLVWHHMHSYQRERVLTFLNPERDPLGSGYHIIQSKIAIGSGGIFGKGWLHGTQSRLEFLPTHTTDFIFSVAGEELGLIGATVILCLFFAVLMRCFFIAKNGQNTFARLLAASLSLTFFLSMFINIGMVMGILPVVGIPLPLISYGGTSSITMLAGFGIIMSIQTHRKLWPS